MLKNKYGLLPLSRFAGIILLILSACTNWKEEPVQSKVLLINALPGSNEATLLFDGQPLTARPLPYDTFTAAYQNIRSGRRIASVQLSNTTAPSVTDTFFITEFRNYTAILTTDITENPVADTIILYPDTLTKPASGKANVRFINMYPDTSASFDLLVNGSLDTLFLNREFMTISRFIAVDVLTEYTFLLLKNGETVSGLSWSLPVSRQNNYTILLTDSLGNITGEKRPRLQLITHQ